MPSALKALIETIAKPGRVEWIGLRPGRREPVIGVANARIDEAGLTGDHARPGKRAITLIQHEHLAAIGAYLGQDPADPALLRRNIVVSGINLLALKERTVQLGGARLLITGPCAPCSRMEEAFGRGGYSAVRGHGGVTARVLTGGPVALSDPVTVTDTLS